MRRFAFLRRCAATFAALLSAPLLHAQNWQMDLEVSLTGYQQAFDARVADGYMPRSVTARSTPAGPRFQMCWQLSTGTWEARHQDTGADFDAAVQTYIATGYRPVFCESYEAAPGDVRYASLWVYEPSMSWSVARDRSLNNYQQVFTAETAAGRQPAWVSGLRTGGTDRVTAVFLGLGVGYAATHNQTESGLQTWLASYPSYRLVSKSSYGAADEVFAAVLHTDANASATFAGSGSEARFEAMRLAQNGYTTALAYSRASGAGIEYTTSAVQDSAGDTWRAVGVQAASTGTFSTFFEPQVQAFMAAQGIRNGVCAVGFQGRLVYAKGFTLAPESWPTTQPTDQMRIASLTKPMTGTAILQLAEAGLFGPLGIDAPLGDFLDLTGWVDARVNDITIRDLLQHRGGWDRDGPVGDPMFKDSTVRSYNSTTYPVSTADIIEWMKSQTFDANVGAEYHYSNFGYCLLGRVIESITGDSYEQYMMRNVFGRIGAASMALGRSLYGDSTAREVFYGNLSGQLRNNVMQEGGGMVLPQYGGWNMSNTDSHGGWVGSAIDLVRFADALEVPGLLLSSSTRAALGLPHPQESLADGYCGMSWFRQFDSSLGVTYLSHNGAYSPDSTYALLEKSSIGYSWCMLFNDDVSGGSMTTMMRNMLNSTLWMTGDFDAQYSRVALFGEGCDLNGKQMRLEPYRGSVPALGERFRYRLSNLPANPLLGLPVILGGFSQTIWNGMPLPLSMASLGAPGCFVNVSVDNIDPYLNQGGFVDVELRIPNNAALLGVELFYQGAFFAPLNAFGAVTSSGMGIRIGM